MTTGYYRQDWRMGGAVPGKVTAAAGSRIAIFDHIFTTGPSPWTKTVIGTNIVTYQAPGGSQVLFEINDNIVLTSSQYSFRARMSVGGGALIPSPSHESNANFGFMLIPIAASTSSTWYDGWYATRTDRFAMITFGGSTSGTGSHTLIVGDIPTFDPADPGLCVLLGYGANIYTAFPNSSVYDDSIFGSSAGGGLRKAGFATIDKQNSFSPAPAGAMPDFSSHLAGTLTAYAGYIPLGFVNIVTATTAFGAINNTCILRGWIPFIRTMPVSSTFNTLFGTFAASSGDTFTADGVDFETFVGNQNYQRYALMLSDGEDLP